MLEDNYLDEANKSVYASLPKRDKSESNSPRKLEEVLNDKLTPQTTPIITIHE